MNFLSDKVWFFRRFGLVFIVFVMFFNFLLVLGRNLWSGGLSRWIVMGRLCMILKRFVKFCCCMGRSFVRVVLWLFWVGVRIIF